MYRVLILLLVVLMLAGCGTTTTQTPTTTPTKQAVTQQQPAKTAAFVGNSNSKKFHRPTCRWAGKISDVNEETFASREDAVNAGYVPCKTCKP